MRFLSHFLFFLAVGLVIATLGCVGPAGPSVTPSSVSPGPISGSNPSPTPTPTPTAQAVSFVFAATQNGVSVFRLDSSGNIVPAGTELVVSSPVIATTEKALVVRSSSGAGTNQTAQIISYAVDANGGLSRQSSTTIQNIGPMAADARFVYVATVAGIFAFDNKEGKLQAVAGSPYNLEPQVCTLCTDLGPDSLALTAGKAFSAEQTDRDASSLTSFNRAPDGSLNGAVESGSASQDSLQVAVTPDGRFLYVITDLGQVACYSANPDGSLTLATGPAEDDTEASYINVTGDGKYLLVSTLTGTIRTFRINSESGATTEIASSPFITGESSTGHTALDPGGRIVVVANGDPFLGPEPTNFMVLARDPGSGALSKTGSVSLSGVTQLLIGTFPFEH